MKAHSFTNYVSNNDATCTADGTKTATCDYGCGATDTIADVGSALGHNVENWTVTKEPTVDEFGEKTGTCTKCGETVTEQIGKLQEELKNEDGTAIEAVDGTPFDPDDEIVATNITGSLGENQKGEVPEGKEVITAENIQIINNGQSKEAGGKVRVTIPVEEDVLKNYEDIELIHIKSDGTSEKIPFEKTDDGIVFETDDLNDFILVGKKKAETPTPTPSGNTDDGANKDDSAKSPTTGYTSHVVFWAILAVISCASFVVFTVYNKKRSHNN
ncbi:MAG: hypothetical protein IKN38_02335 [Clostridia bacterium]|nr:hypothetical protein [Clostridia bacterium]